MRQGVPGPTSMRRPSSNHQGGVSRWTSTPGSWRRASTRARLEAATALCAIVGPLSEVEGIQPQLGAEGPPQLPRAVELALDVFAHEPVEGSLGEEVSAPARRIFQERERRDAAAVAQ